MPDLVTVSESGLSGYAASTWYGVLAPAGTPGPIIQRLNVEFGRALNAPDVKTVLLAQGFDLAGGTPDQFAAHSRAETSKWAKVISATGLTAD